MAVAQPLALPCAGGAVPKPDWLGKSIQLRMDWLPGDVLSLISTVSPLSVTQQIVGTVVAQTLCANQCVDPGDLSLGDLFWDLAGLAVPNPNGTPASLGWWIGQKLQYYAFNTMCQCSSGVEVIPPPVLPTPPNGSQPFPTDPELQPPLDRIERNQQTSVDAIKQLYNGEQHVSSILGDLYVRSVPALISNPITVASNVSGEGCVDLPIFSDPISTPFSPWATHVEVVCHSIPANTGIRGTLNPRLYGVGSLYFDANYSTQYAPNITGRQSIHYWREVMRLPARTQTYRVCWYLQPGANVSLRIYSPNPDNVMYAMSSGAQYGWLPFHNEPSPPNWTDPPIYPTPPATSALSGPKP